MRLLNAETLRLETVSPGSKTPYAILSHRWTEDEVSFGDIQRGTADKRSAFRKLRGCCDAALGDGLTHVWIDTCCIDQSSSNELSESINSMFRWYQEAEVCYAYLHDATDEHDYLASEWFDRGWTLQELIAPKEVDFYGMKWNRFGHRSGLSPSLSSKTGIAERCLCGGDLASASIAERMSWAAQRKTTKPEDTAYCLLGIFNIHMPLIYGEGAEKAFTRLQCEILNNLTSEDYSWLAWSSPAGDQAAGVPATGAGMLDGMLARSPAFFGKCSDVVLRHKGAATSARVNVANVSINVRLPVVQKGDGQEVLLLGCHWRQDYWNIIVIPVHEHLGRYYRTSRQTSTCPEDQWPETPLQYDTTLSSKPYVELEDTAENPFYAIKPLPLGLRVVDVLPSGAWEPGPYTHIRIVKGDFSLVRLERDADADGGPDPHHYVLKLEKSISRDPICRFGILKRDDLMSQANDDTTTFGKAVSIPGQSGALSARAISRPVHGKETYVVEIFMDETRSTRSASRSRVMPHLPSELEAAQDARLARETAREATEAADAKNREMWQQEVTRLENILAGIIITCISVTAVSFWMMWQASMFLALISYVIILSAGPALQVDISRARRQLRGQRTGYGTVN